MIYTIKKGQHSCKHTLSAHSGTVREARIVTVDESWRHEGIKSIHKLWGFGYGYQHQINSARLGLKLFADYFRLVTYIYDAGIRLKEKKIKDYPYNTTFASSIDFVSGLLVFNVDGTEVKVSVTQTPKAGFYLFPYFGGNEVPERDVITQIIRI